MDLESPASSLGFKCLDSDYWFKMLLLRGLRNELIPLEYIIVLTKERKIDNDNQTESGCLGAKLTQCICVRASIDRKHI